jgi:hypothetical protein
VQASVQLHRHSGGETGPQAIPANRYGILVKLSIYAQAGIQLHRHSGGETGSQAIPANRCGP